MITELLPRYIEAHGETGTYEILRSIIIDGHEVAWMKYSTTIQYDMMGLGREGQPAYDYRLYCECYFTENVGWKFMDNGHVAGIHGGDKCIRFEAACDLRIREIREEYLEQFDVPRGGTYFFLKHVDAIVADLIERDKRHEFIGEGTNGATFWGGHFYIKTLVQILDVNMGLIHEHIDRLKSEKKISLEGFVVKEYREPPRSRWTKDFTYEGEGNTVTGFLPSHPNMRQDYKLVLRDKAGKNVDTQYIPLVHTPTFGPDAEDVASANAKAAEMVNALLQKL